MKYWFKSICISMQMERTTGPVYNITPVLNYGDFNTNLQIVAFVQHFQKHSCVSFFTTLLKNLPLFSQRIIIEVIGEHIHVFLTDMTPCLFFYGFIIAHIVHCTWLIITISSIASYTQHWWSNWLSLVWSRIVKSHIIPRPPIDHKENDIGFWQNMLQRKRDNKAWVSLRCMNPSICQNSNWTENKTGTT